MLMHSRIVMNAFMCHALPNQFEVMDDEDDTLSVRDGDKKKKVTSGHLFPLRHEVWLWQHHPLCTWRQRGQPHTVYLEDHQPLLPIHEEGLVPARWVQERFYPGYIPMLPIDGSNKMLPTGPASWCLLLGLAPCCNRPSTMVSIIGSSTMLPIVQALWCCMGPATCYP